MLKIKDDVNLKELEKFRFSPVKVKQYNEPDECYKIEFYDRTKFIDRDYGHATYQRVVINIHDRKIRFYCMSGEKYNKHWADDLIQAGLVEKVEDKQ